ncbi:MAG: hypothetical protein VX210_04250, partial [Myxococcota bacterium]|nr:hypothetical protein [Myxococcota bacterium]
MAGIIEKLAPSTDLAGVEVSTNSKTAPGFEACLASQSLAGDGPEQASPLATLPSESRQSTDGSAGELSNTLKPISAEARSESSQATSDAALLIKSLGSMIEPELKPAPAGLEALGKVIALRTGKSSVAVAGEGATVAETAIEKVVSSTVGPGLDIDSKLTGMVPTTPSPNTAAQPVLAIADHKTDAILSASNGGSPELQLANSTKNTTVNTQTAASISVSTSTSESAKTSVGMSNAQAPTSGSMAEKPSASVIPQASNHLSATSMPMQNVPGPEAMLATNTTALADASGALATESEEGIRAKVVQATTETPSKTLAGTPANAQFSHDEIDGALAPLKEVVAKPGLRVAPMSNQATEAVPAQAQSSASVAQTTKPTSPELKTGNSIEAHTSPLQPVAARQNEAAVTSSSSIAMSQDTTRAAAVTQAGSSAPKDAKAKERAPASATRRSSVATALAGPAASTSNEATT